MTPVRDGDRVSLALTWGGLALLLWLTYLVVRPFLTALGWSCVLAVMTYPVYDELARRWGKTSAALVTTLGTTILVVAPLAAVGTSFAREAIDISMNVQAAFAEGRLQWIERSWDAIEQRLPPGSRMDFATAVSTAVRDGAAFLVARSGSIVTGAGELAVNLVLALFATFFLLRDADAIMRGVRRLLPMEPAEREALIERTRQLIYVGVVSSAVVAALQGILGGLAFWIVGIDAPVFWGVVMAFFCLLPFGAWVIWLPAAIILMAGGDVTHGLILAALGAGIVSAVDNVIRPWLVSGRVHINGLVIFVSLLGGISAFGLLGLVLGPVLVVTALSFLTGYLNHEH